MPGHDVFKEHPFRCIGYGYGVGRALSGHVGLPLIRLCHTSATAFIFGHTIYKPYLVSKRGASGTRVTMTAADTLIYELVASGFIPPLVAGIVRRGAGNLSSSLPRSMHRWGPSFLALAAVPIVCVPADALVDAVMDATIRNVYF